MTSSYKRLGDHIQLKKEKNVNLTATKLLGINIDKFFMPSVANVIGTDMTNYKIVKKNQFACNRMHVGRDYRIPIALSKDSEDFMVSPAYDVFEIIDPKYLLPEYLMMWFKRIEFDRNAWFHTDADVRGGLPWESFANLKLPIPSPEKQQQLVNEYHTLQKRIDLNNQLIAKLEETAQTIYKRWFVEFEFPDENGKPYKSNGGKMAWCEELEKEIPAGWELGKLSDFIDIKNGKTRPFAEGIIPLYGGNGIIDYVNDFNYENLNIIGRVGAYCGSVFFEERKAWISDNALAGISKNKTLYLDYLILINLSLNSKSEGSSHPLLTQGILNDISIVKSNTFNIYLIFENVVKPIFTHLNTIKEQNQKLEELKELLLGKMAKGN